MSSEFPYGSEGSGSAADGSPGPSLDAPLPPFSEGSGPDRPAPPTGCFRLERTNTGLALISPRGTVMNVYGARDVRRARMERDRLNVRARAST